MTDKFIIRRVRAKEPSYKSVMLWSDTFDMLKEICDDNGVKMCALVDSMVRFCVDGLEVVEEDGS